MGNFPYYSGSLYCLGFSLRIWILEEARTTAFHFGQYCEWIFFRGYSSDLLCGLYWQSYLFDRGWSETDCLEICKDLAGLRCCLHHSFRAYTKVITFSSSILRFIQHASPMASSESQCFVFSVILTVFHWSNVFIFFFSFLLACNCECE